MVKTKGHNDLYITPVEKLYKRERMVRRKSLCSPDKKIKTNAESTKKNW
jgi:hypothetical protein